MHSRIAISTQQILRDIYTPGVARVCLAIQKDAAKAFEYTYLGRAVGIVTDGSAILDLGNTGLRVAPPVIESTAALFASLVGISGIPILVESAVVDHIVEVVCAIAPSFGAILLAGIGAPRCFEIEQKLRARLAVLVLRRLEDIVQGRLLHDARCCHSLPVRLRILSSVVSTMPSSPTLVSTLSGRLRACADDS
jgi:malate dehydrogenase (oxaloacetate-decarboxylating)